MNLYCIEDTDEWKHMNYEMGLMGTLIATSSDKELMVKYIQSPMWDEVDESISATSVAVQS